MQQIHKDLGSYNLHMIETNKYKTVTMRIVFQRPIVKEEITKRNILSDILLQSTKKYSTKRDMIIEAENLYAADIYNNTQRVGNYIMTSFILQVLNDKYTEEGNLEKAISFLSEIIYNPDVKDNRFMQDKLSIVKKECELSLSTLKEDPSEYASIRLKEAYSSDSPISYRMTGYIEDLEKINENNLYEYYLNMLDKDFVDIYIIGDFSSKEMLQIVKKYYKFRKIKKKVTPYELDLPKLHKRKLLAKEISNNNQSKLGLVCPIIKPTDYEKKYSLVLANIILGGTGDSKLFKTVREKHSLCYTIYSNFSALDSTITIYAGIDKENYEKSVELITQILEQMKKGKFTEKDIKIAKEIYTGAMSSIEENPTTVLRELISEDILNMKPYQERTTIMNKITKKQIVSAFKKIKIDTIFLLEGDKNATD